MCQSRFRNSHFCLCPFCVGRAQAQSFIIRWYRSTGWDEKWCSSDQNRYIFDFTSWPKPEFIMLVLRKWRHLLGKNIRFCIGVSEKVHFDRHCHQSHLVWNLPLYSRHQSWKLTCLIYLVIALLSLLSLQGAACSISTFHHDEFILCWCFIFHFYFEPCFPVKISLFKFYHLLWCVRWNFMVIDRRGTRHPLNYLLFTVHA